MQTIGEKIEETRKRKGISLFLKPLKRQKSVEISF